MQVTIHDVGVCDRCPLRAGASVACFSLSFGRIGKCGGCMHYGDPAVCGTCERDSNLLLRRDHHGTEEAGVTCGMCQRDVRLLRLRDRYEKGLPDKVEKQMNTDCAAEAGRRPMVDAVQDWLRES